MNINLLIIHCYGGKGSIERFCEDLKEHATKIVKYEKKKKKK